MAGAARRHALSAVSGAFSLPDRSSAVMTLLLLATMLAQCSAPLFHGALRGVRPLSALHRQESAQNPEALADELAPDGASVVVGKFEHHYQLVRRDDVDEAA